MYGDIYNFAYRDQLAETLNPLIPPMSTYKQAAATDKRLSATL